MTTRPWLAPGLSIRERCDILIREAQSDGWRVVRSPTDRLSITDPVTKRIRLSPLVLIYAPGPGKHPRASPALAYTLAHELKHKQQFGRNRFIAAVKAAAYLSNRRVRLSMEIEAEAEEAVCRYVMLGKLTVTATTLGGQKFPYYTGADQQKVEAMILNLAAKILVEEGIN